MINRKALIFFVLLIVAMASLLILQGLSWHGTLWETEPPLLRVGESPLPLEATTLQGEKVSLGDLKGKVVLVNFWATWCPPCLEEIPSLNKTYEELKDQGFVLLSFSIDFNGRKILPGFIKEYDIKYPIVLDSDQKYARNFSVLGVPENILLGSDGKVVEKRYGADDWTSPEIRKKITTLLAQKGLK